MPQTYPCNFTIPANSNNGSRLVGNGFNATPRLNAGDSLNVIVRYAGPNPPASLNAMYVITPAETAPSNQTAPSPFFAGAKYFCAGPFTASQDASGPTFTFPTLTYNGGTPGNYELTLVVFDSANPPTQWSEDPEFDTGN